MATIFWWPLTAALLHMVEEFVYPGGFATWGPKHQPDSQVSSTLRSNIIVSSLVIIGCVAVGLVGRTDLGVNMWLGVAAILASNAGSHLIDSIRARSYSPGLVTGLVLYVPMTIAGNVYFVYEDLVAFHTAIAVFVIGSSYYFLTTYVRLWRERRQNTRAATPPASESKS